MKPKILLVDDHVGDISWLIDFLEYRGFQVEQETNEEAARARLRTIKDQLGLTGGPRGATDDGGLKAGKHDNITKGQSAPFALAIIDIMVSVKDIMDLVELDDSFYESSRETGVRLCLYARKDLEISEADLPIVCISARSDSATIRRQLGTLGIRLFGRVPQTREDSIREYLEKTLPRAEELLDHAGSQER